MAPCVHVRDIKKGTTVMKMQPGMTMLMSRNHPHRRIPAAVLALGLGGLGVHKFYMGRLIPGLVHVLLSCFFGLGWVVGIVEGVRYLKMTDSEYERTYVTGSRSWL